MMTDGALVRVVLTVVFLIAVFAVEYTLSRARARRAQLLRAEKSAYQARLDEALRIVAEERASEPKDVSQNAVASRRDYHALTPRERQAKKDWALARMMRHPKIPSWTRDEEYLSLVLNAARGGCVEALNKLADYAFRRRDYVEAYYWTLKLEMAGGNVTGAQPSIILQHWLKHSAADEFCDFHSGFHEGQFLFARSVLRIRSGVDREKGQRRLRKLVDAENQDAVLYAEKNGFEASSGERSDDDKKLC